MIDILKKENKALAIFKNSILSRPCRVTLVKLIKKKIISYGSLSVFCNRRAAQGA